MNKKVVIIIAIVVAILAVWFFFFRKKEKPVVVETENPKYGHIYTSVTATGYVQPVDTVAVGTQVSGTLKYIYADFNSQVKKGQLIAELDKVLLQAEVDRNKGNLASAQSQLVYQQAQFNREQQLYNVGAVSKADYDNQNYLFQAAKAAVESARAALATAQRNLFFCEIYSPIDGVVLSRSVSVGQTVAASFNTPTLFILAKDITKMQVQANVDEADIGNVKDSQRVSFTVDAYLEDEFAGRVQEIRLKPTVSSNVVTYTTIISAPNEDMKLKPGMTATVTIYTSEKNHVLLIPAKALMFKPDSVMAKKYTVISIAPAAAEKHKSSKPVTGGGDQDSTQRQHADTSKVTANYVWVQQGDTLLQKKVVIGLNDNTHAEVVSGLTEQDAVITAMTQEAEAKSSKQSGSGSSPFMPQRRRR